MARSTRKQRQRRTRERKAQNAGRVVDTRTTQRTVTVRRAVPTPRPPRRDARRLARAVDPLAATGRDVSKRLEKAKNAPLQHAPDMALMRPGEAYTRKPQSLQDNTKLNALDQRMCKPRPSPSRGGGKGRSFIPWCR